MCSRAENLIAELEDSIGIELDGNFSTTDAGLCQHETCIHPECDCWDTFERNIENQLEKQESERRAEMDAMFSLYKAEVKAGVYEPTTVEDRNLLEKF